MLPVYHDWLCSRQAWLIPSVVYFSAHLPHPFSSTILLILTSLSLRFISAFQSALQTLTWNPHVHLFPTIINSWAHPFHLKFISSIHIRAALPKHATQQATSLVHNLQWLGKKGPLPLPGFPAVWTPAHPTRSLGLCSLTMAHCPLLLHTCHASCLRVPWMWPGHASPFS